MTQYAGFYILIISVTAVLITAYDKLAAKILPRNRVPEKVLLGIGLLGGATAEYLTMQLIRHKTKHKKFMTGLPLMMVMHIAVVAALLFFN